jgi:hypothetical protein
MPNPEALLTSTSMPPSSAVADSIIALIESGFDMSAAS